MFRLPCRKGRDHKMAENQLLVMTDHIWGPDLHTMHTSPPPPQHTHKHAEHLLSLLPIFHAFSLFFSCLIFPSVTNLCLTFSWQRAAILHPGNTRGTSTKMQIHKGGEHKHWSHSQSCTLGSVVWSVPAQIWGRNRPVWWCYLLDERRLRSRLCAGSSAGPIYTRHPPQHIIW